MWNIENDSRKVGPGDEVDWLRSDLDESPVIAIKKKSLVNKLDDLARRKFGDDGHWRQVEAPCQASVIGPMKTAESWVSLNIIVSSKVATRFWHNLITRLPWRIFFEGDGGPLFHLFPTPLLPRLYS